MVNKLFWGAVFRDAGTAAPVPSILLRIVNSEPLAFEMRALI